MHSGAFRAINAAATPSGSAPLARWVPRTPRPGCGAQRIIGLPGDQPGTLLHWDGQGATGRRLVTGCGPTTATGHPWCPCCSQGRRVAAVSFCGPWLPGFCCPPGGTLGSDLCACSRVGPWQWGAGHRLLPAPTRQPSFFCSSCLKRGGLYCSHLPTHIAPWLLSGEGWGEMLIAYLAFFARSLGSSSVLVSFGACLVEWAWCPVCYRYGWPQFLSSSLCL